MAHTDKTHIVDALIKKEQKKLERILKNPKYINRMNEAHEFHDAMCGLIWEAAGKPHAPDCSNTVDRICGHGVCFYCDTWREIHNGNHSYRKSR